MSITSTTLHRWCKDVGNETYELMFSAIQRAYNVGNQRASLLIGIISQIPEAPSFIRVR